MTLRDWLEKNRVSRADFAKRVGVSDVQITRVINGDRQASLKLALAIERETGGIVRPRDLMRQSA
jgi:3,4-dihydroxy 2-butanone 4-phosphate synthase/GTP cyclohydrolase II